MSSPGLASLAVEVLACLANGIELRLELRLELRWSHGWSYGWKLLKHCQHPPHAPSMLTMLTAMSCLLLLLMSSTLVAVTACSFPHHMLCPELGSRGSGALCFGCPSHLLSMSSVADASHVMASYTCYEAHHGQASLHHIPP